MKPDTQWLLRILKTEMKSVRRAVDKVESTNNAKFEAQNEWRAQMKDQTAAFVTRRELWGAVVTVITIVISAMALMNKG